MRKGRHAVGALCLAAALAVGVVGQEMQQKTSYPGGHLKFTYEATYAGQSSTARTTMEIVPLADGRYEVKTSGDQVVPADRVRVGFLGLGFMGLGFRVRDGEQGGIDLSGLSALEQLSLAAGKTYLLPDGGTFAAGAADQIAGIDVVRGTYTHEDAPSYQVEIAWALSPEVRSLLPSPPFLKLLERKTTGGAFEAVAQVLLTEFVR